MTTLSEIVQMSAMLKYAKPRSGETVAYKYVYAKPNQLDLDEIALMSVCQSRLGGWAVEYHQNKWVEPRLEYSKLFAYDSLEQARARNMMGNILLFRCLVTDIESLGCRGVDRHCNPESYWSPGGLIACYHTPKSEDDREFMERFNQGIILVPKIKLLDVVT